MQLKKAVFFIENSFFWLDMWFILSILFSIFFKLIKIST